MKSKLQKLKKKAWSLCSLWVRLQYSDALGQVTCYTCGITRHYKLMQAGHFVAGRTNAILFDVRGIRPQCYGCNCMQGGRPLEYMKHLESDLGIKKARKLRDDLLFKKRNEIKKFMVAELEILIASYEQKIDKLGKVDYA